MKHSEQKLLYENPRENKNICINKQIFSLKKNNPGFRDIMIIKN